MTESPTRSPDTIAILHVTTLLDEARMRQIIAAYQRQVDEHYYPHWGRRATLVYVAPGAIPPPGAWWLAFLDDADQAGALGYHDITPEGLPVGKVFVGTTLKYGGQPSVTGSHELLEMLGDPDINCLVQDRDNPRRFWCYETCDAVERDEDGYEIDGVPVSNFVLPAYFQTFRTQGPFDYGNLLNGPVPNMCAGGYMAYVEDGTWGQQLNRGFMSRDERLRVQWQSQPHEGSRRLKRMRGKSQWVPSVPMTGGSPGAGQAP